MIENRKKRVLYSLVINVAVILIALFVFRPFFEEIDDTHIAMISEGAYGYRESHILISNVLLGRLYVLLSTLVPSVRWHTTLQYIFIFCAYVSLTYALSKHKNGVIISVAAVLSTFYEVYVSLQYTKTGTFICAAGLLLGLECVRELYNAKNREEMQKTDKVDAIIYGICCYLLIFYGSTLRDDTFFIACVPIAFYGVYELLYTKQLKQYIAVLVPIVMTVFLFTFADNYINASDETWDRYSDYGDVRVELTDRRYAILDYPTYGEELKKLNVSENDAFVILTYQFGDDVVFSTERWQEILDAFPPTKITDMTFRTWYGNVRDEFSKFQISLYLLIAYVAIVLFISIKRGKAFRLFTIILMGMLCISALFYFHYSGRWSHRLVASLVLAAIYTVSFILCYESEESGDECTAFANVSLQQVVVKGSLAIACIAILLNIGVFIKSSKQYKDYCIEQKETIDILNSVKQDALNDDNSPLYVADTFMFQNVWKYDVFKPSELGELKNFVTFGSWFVNSPITKNITESYGYLNPYDALKSGSDNVVLLDKNMRDYKLLFIKEHYGVELDK